MKVYLIEHEFEVDGGYGDPIWTGTIIAAFTNKEAAEQFKEKYNNPHEYGDDYFLCGELCVREVELFTDNIPEFNWIPSSSKMHEDELIRKE